MITNVPTALTGRRAARIACLISMMVLLFGETSYSQLTPPDDDGDQPTVQRQFLPLIGYSTDTSFFGGALFQRINYGEESDRPFLSNGRADVTGSVRGEWIGKVTYDRSRSFGRDIRSTGSLLLFRSQISHYFGLGNESEFKQDLYDDRFFFFENREAEFLYRARTRIGRFGVDGNLDLLADLHVSYQDASVREEESRFAEDIPGGNVRGWTNQLGLGLIVDDRDSEFGPTEGFRYEGGARMSNSLIGSDFNYTTLWGEMRHYLPLFREVVLAQKIAAEHTIGNTPFWGLATLGDQYGLRGYHLDRFQGDSSILHILEARTWLFSIFDGEIRFGGQLFWDSGRVFSDFDSNRFFSDWNHTYGFGGALSVFNPDFIVRGEMGFSGETVRVYAGVGYVF